MWIMSHFISLSCFTVGSILYPGGLVDTVAVALGVTKVSEEGAEWVPMEGAEWDIGTLVG